MTDSVLPGSTMWWCSLECSRPQLPKFFIGVGIEPRTKIDTSTGVKEVLKVQYLLKKGNGAHDLQLLNI